MKKNSYRAEDIEVLEGLEPVRKRPGMYIGTTDGDHGLFQLVKEILDNSIDEAMNGHASNIIVTLHDDAQSVTIEDNGRGIPVDTHPKFKKSALELILGTLHAGGKFSDQNYHSAGGLHGVGASVVNALSVELVANVKRDGFEWRQEFQRGKAKGPVKKGKATKQTGTSIYFRPDPEIFSNTFFNSERLELLVKEKAFLNKGIKLILNNERDNTTQEFKFDDGLQSYLKELLNRDGVQALGGSSCYLEKSDGIKVETAFCWVEGSSGRFYSYVNGIYTPLGGTHEDGFKSGLGKALRNYISVHNLLPKALKLTADDLREGLIGLLSVTVPGSIVQLQFQGQTKEKLNNPEVAPPVESLMRAFEDFLNSKPSVASAIVERILDAARARMAAKSAVEAVSRKSALTRRLNLPGKLADCSSSKAHNSELFIVEGDSAGGSAKQGRNREYQAIFPLRGKVLNSIAAGSSKLAENQELSDLVSALGCGSGSQLDLKRLRYDKVIILADADSDGMHISALLLAFFYKQLRPLIEGGHLFLGLPPLFKIKLGTGAKEEVVWAYTDRERDAIVAAEKKRKIQVTRFKGLGEMNPKTLWDTTLNPRSRNLLKIQIVSERDADQMFGLLFGKEVAPRFKLIQENAHRLELDL